MSYLLFKAFSLLVQLGAEMSYLNPITFNNRVVFNGQKDSFLSKLNESDETANMGLSLNC